MKTKYLNTPVCTNNIVYFILILRKLLVRYLYLYIVVTIFSCSTRQRWLCINAVVCEFKCGTDASGSNRNNSTIIYYNMYLCVHRNNESPGKALFFIIAITTVWRFHLGLSFCVSPRLTRTPNFWKEKPPKTIIVVQIVSLLSFYKYIQLTSTSTINVPTNCHLIRIWHHYNTNS